MQELFSIEQLVEATGGRAQNISADFITSISIDSRSLDEGALYVAIKGDRFDGHGFVHKAVVNGAAAALISDKKALELAGLPLIIVPDPLKALEKIACVARARSTAKIVAVTGSAGKTTTKSMVQQILSRVGVTHASIKSFNNHWGVPLMLANMPPSAQFGVFEIGMNHAGEITPLVKMVRPHVALVTNVGPAHIGNFNNLEGIAQAKAEIAQGVEPGGMVIINGDHDFLHVFKKATQKHGDVNFQTFGFEKSSEIGIFDYRATQSGARAQARFGVVPVNFDLCVPGAHMVSNATGALCVAHSLGVDFGVAVEGLADFSASEGRGRIYEFGKSGNKVVLIDESYNANPASMAAALIQFGERDGEVGAKILVLGDMYELGTSSAKFHLDLIPQIEMSGVDQLLLVGENMRALSAEFSQKIKVTWVGKVSQIDKGFVNSLDWGDTIMVKGSYGVSLSQIVAAIRTHFEGVD